MINLILYTWYLLSPPMPRPVCVLWVSQTPDKPAIVESCGESIYNRLPELQIDIIAPGGVTVCTLAGPAILNDLVISCGLSGKLDQYRLSLAELPRVFVICAATISHPGPPTAADIAAAGCPPGAVGDWRLMVTKEEVQPAPVCIPAPLMIGPGLFDQPAAVDDLYTAAPLQLLGGRLIWFGLAAGDCPGGLSGIDPATGAATPCGMAGASIPVITWQNRYNQDIYNAAIAAGVPARLLKSIIMQESQFWPVWDNSEFGIGQLTRAGFDLALRYNPGIAPGYIGDSEQGQRDTITALIYRLSCNNCSIIQIAESERDNIIIYALALRGAYCLSGIQSATGPAWEIAAAIYHAGGSCITPAGICPAGKGYIERVIQ